MPLSRRSQHPTHVSAKVRSHNNGDREVQVMHYSGPLPPATELNAYNQICPGSADRLITMAEQQSKHRQDLETNVIKNDIRKSYLGMILGFIIAIIGLCISGYVIIQGQPIAGGILGSTTLLGMVTVFVMGHKSRQNDIKNKQ